MLRGNLITSSDVIIGTQIMSVAGMEVRETWSKPLKLGKISESDEAFKLRPLNV